MARDTTLERQLELVHVMMLLSYENKNKKIYG